MAVVIRAILLPRAGLAGDVDDFLAWTRAIAADGLGHAYNQPISFPPVLPWTWWLLGRIAPPILSPTPGDPAALMLIKLPATIADLAIAGIVGWALARRGFPGWGVAAAVGLLVVPASWYVSAWWAQFDALYVLPMLAAWLLLRDDRPDWAALAIAIGLMTKPQALPLLVPFAAFYLRRYGLPGSVRAGIVGAVTIVVLWLPFLAAGGPAAYAGNLARYADTFAVLSLRAWNPWWILTELAGGGQLVADTVPILGPITLRWVGAGLAVLLELVVLAGVWRRPTAAGLAWGLAAASLAAFIGLTEMHERYAVACLAFLALAWPDRLAVGAWLVAALTISLNLVAAVPPSGGPGSVIPVAGLPGLTGSVVMTGLLAASIAGLRRAPDTPGERRSAGPSGA